MPLATHHHRRGVRAASTVQGRHPGTAVLMRSQYVVARYAIDLLGGDSRGIGYLLEHRISDVTAFLETVRLVGEGGTVIDPEVVPQLLTAATAALTSMH